MAVEISISGASATENDHLAYTVSLSETSTRVVTVNYRTTSNTPTTVGNYNADVDWTGGTLTFQPGETTKVIYVSSNSDSNQEFDEASILELYHPSNASFGNNAVTLREKAFVLDNDGGPYLAVSVSDLVLSEGDNGRPKANFTVKLSRPQTDTVTVSYKTVDGSAKAGDDYVAKSGKVTFLPGQTEATVDVTLTPDRTFEPDEFFFLSVDPGNSDIGTDDSIGKAQILDDDAPDDLPQITIEGFSGAEGVSSLEYKVVLSEPSDRSVTVNYRTVSDMPTFAGNYNADVDWAGNTVTFAPGETAKSIFIDTNSDSNVEFDEPVILELYNPDIAVFGNDAATLKEKAFILDNDGGTYLALSVSDMAIAEGDSGRPEAIFTVKLSRPQDENVTVSYKTINGSATAGEDYVAKSGSLTFLPGQTEASVAVTLTPDRAFEPDEFFFLAVNPGNSDIGTNDAVGKAQILDDDAPDNLPQIAIEGISGFEGVNSLEYKIVLSEASDRNVTVNYRTMSDTPSIAGNYNADVDWKGGTVTFAPGETAKSVYVDTNSDSTDEFDEPIILELYDPDNAVFGNNAVTLREKTFVIDNDGSPDLALSVSDLVLVEGDSGRPEAVFTVKLSRPQDENVTISYKTVDGTALAGDDYVAKTGKITFVRGQTEASVAVTLPPDRDFEASEFFFLAVDPGNSDIGTNDAVGKALILDDDAPDTLPQISVEGISAAEGVNSIEFKVMLSEASDRNITVNYRMATETPATVGNYSDDVDWVSGTLTFEPGQTSKSIYPDTNSDSADETDEAAVFELYDPTYAVFGDGQTVLQSTAFVMDNDGGIDRSVYVSSPTVVEEFDGETAFAKFIVSLSRPYEDTISFKYQTQNGTAKAKQDIQPAKGKVTFEPGQTEAAVMVKILDDFRSESNETFALNLKTPLPAGIEEYQIGVTGVATIRDNELSGTNGTDTLIGSAASEGINGKGGNDELSDKAGNDFVNGGAGKDTLINGKGNDILNGGNGRDTLTFEGNGRFKVDLSKGGYQSTGRGKDKIVKIEDVTGGNKNDTFKGNGKANKLDGGKGNDKLSGEGSKDILNGGKGNDILNGGDGNDKLIGSGGKDTLNGGKHTDRLLGGGGKDKLNGGDGKDILDGQAGADILTGGKDNDTFVYSKRGGKDVITDFQDDIDRIDFNGLGRPKKIMNSAVQDGDDVVFEFTNKHMLTVENMTIKEISDDILG